MYRHDLLKCISRQTLTNGGLQTSRLYRICHRSSIILPGAPRCSSALLLNQKFGRVTLRQPHSDINKSSFRRSSGKSSKPLVQPESESEPVEDPFGPEEPPEEAIRQKRVLRAGNILMAIAVLWSIPCVLAVYRNDRQSLANMLRFGALSWDSINEGRYYTIITSCFTHFTPIHLIFNVLSFRAFVQVLSMVPGVQPFHIYAISLASGIAGSMLTIKSWSWTDRPQWTRPVVGASGMVLGLAAVATCWRPFTPMLVFFAIPAPLWTITIGYALFDAYNIQSQNSWVAHAAHMGGTLAGVGFYLAFMRRNGGYVWMQLDRLLKR